MTTYITFILIVVGLALLIILFRLLGAWMLRINEVIDLLRAINQKLKDERAEGME